MERDPLLLLNRTSSSSSHSTSSSSPFLHSTSRRRRRFPVMSTTMIRSLFPFSAANSDLPFSYMISETTLFLRRSFALFLFFAALLFVFNSARSFRLLSLSSSPSFSGVRFVFPSSHYAFPKNSDEFRLERVLKRAANKDNTVIITTLNEAWAAPNSIIDLFLESFRIGDHTRRLLNHLVIVALDDKAFIRCLSLHPHCVTLVTEGVDFSKEAFFMTPDYLKMMWRRIDFLRTVLELGYNFVFTDADVMWLRDPFPLFDPEDDFQIACDHFSGDPLDLDNRPNGGFNFVQSNNRTIEFYKFWYSSQEKYPGYHDQDVLNFIKHNPYISEIGLTMRFLDTAYFGGFCEPSKDLNEVCTMHANCCFGMSSKLNDLTILLEDWRFFMSLSPSSKRSIRYSWRVPRNCSLGELHPANSPKESQEPEDGS